MAAQQGPLGTIDNPLSTRVAPDSFQGTMVSVTTVAQTLTALLAAATHTQTPKTNRQVVELQNQGAGVLYVGDSNVTTSNGRKVDSTVGDGAMTIPLKDTDDVYLVGDAACSVYVTQV